MHFQRQQNTSRQYCFFLRKGNFEVLILPRKLCTILKLYHNFLLMTFVSRWKSSRNIKITFSPSAYKIVPRYSKSWHDFEVNEQDFDHHQNRVTPRKIVARFLQKFWVALWYPNRVTTLKSWHDLVKILKKMTVTTKSRHGKTQPWRDFLHAYKNPALFITAHRFFSYCYSAKFFPEIQPTKFTHFKPNSNLLNHHQHQIHLTFFIPKP